MTADKRPLRIAFACAGLACGMAGLAFASVPLYDLFCKATGFNGTPLVGSLPAGTVVDRAISVRLDANVMSGLSWRFAPQTPEVTVKLGQTTTVLYRITNIGPTPSTGIATFNVQPDLAGAYFVKLECFCFTEQTLNPGETRESAVVFYVDPALMQDQDVKDLPSLTLSYSFFPSRNGAPVEAAAATQIPYSATR